jgi:serine/threonine-protein kinase
MSGDPDAPDETERTVFMPSQPTTPADPASNPTGDAAADAAPAQPAPTAWIAPAASAPAPSPAPPAGRPQVGPGSVLNNIYEVKRFLARGGMGEVYEGVNVNTDERVAIKVMLPALAADPNVQAMFRKEARTLTKLHHPAVVQYRVLAQEPAFDVFYIVTEFIDGAALSDLLPTLKPSPAQLKLLTRRLAEGLGAAHALGAVHRDISPDNVLLPDRRIEQAKIIDFGIAKDMDPSKGTIIGDGFAGKLGYVAPEQFGDYDRQVGPWTDVYSLGLVVLAAAQGRDVDMGATLVEAVDRRRAGPDLSAAPDELRPVLARMLAADPAQRLRSMEEVVAALDEGPTPVTASPPAAAPPSPARAKRKAPLLIGGGVALVAVIGAAAFLLSRGGGEPPAQQAAASATGTVSLRRVVEDALPTVGCSWLNLVDLNQGPAGAALRLRGVAGRPAAAQEALGGAASRAGTTLADVNLDEVAPVGEPLCRTLDTVVPLRANTGALSTPQRKFEMQRQTNGVLAGRAIINMNVRDPATDFALVGLEPDGKMDIIFRSRAEFEQLKAQLANVADAPIADLGGGAYRLQIDTTHTGWSGLLLITGKGPFDPKLLQGDAASRGEAWTTRFRDAAEAGGWKADMVWYRTVQAGG